MYSDHQRNHENHVRGVHTVILWNKSRWIIHWASTQNKLTRDSWSGPEATRLDLQWWLKWDSFLEHANEVAYDLDLEQSFLSARDAYECTKPPRGGD